MDASTIGAVVNILTQTLSTDNNIRNNAERELDKYKPDGGNYLMLMATILAEDSVMGNVRVQAGIQSKNTLSSNNEIEAQSKANAWVGLPIDKRNYIKTCYLKTLNSTEHGPRHTAAMIIAKIAGIELQRGLWPELFGMLIQGISEGGEGIKLSGLSTLGYVCEEISPNDVKQEELNAVLGKVVEHMKPTQTAEVYEVACKAMYNMLEFAQKNFEEEGDRNQIMQDCCTAATSGPNIKIRVLGYECLVRINMIYYDKMQPYMQTLFNITMQSMKADEDLVAMQAFEFWSTMCDEEINLERVEEEAIENGEEVPVINMHYVKAALRHLVPILLEALTKVEETDEDDETTWNVPKAATVCLSLVAQTVRDDVLEHVMPFVNKHVGSNDWRHRDAAISAFGNVLEGPGADKVLRIVMDVLPFFLNHLKTETNNQVRDTTAWAVGVICLRYMHHIPQQHWGDIIKQLAERLTDEPRVASKVVFCMHSIAENYAEFGMKNESGASNVFSPMLVFIVEKIVAMIDRPEWDECNLRCRSFEALQNFVMVAPTDQQALIMGLLNNAMLRLSTSLNIALTSEDLKDEHMHLQSWLCATIQVICRKLDVHMRPHANNIMAMMLRVIETNPVAIEEAFLTISAIADITEGAFLEYMKALHGPLIAGLNNSNSYSLCSICIGLTGDISRAIGPAMVPYCNDIMEKLLQTLINKTANRFLKPQVISAFNEISLAIEVEFDKYITTLMPMLGQASQVKIVNADDEEFIDYVNQLHESILDAYAGILNAFEKKRDALIPYMNNIFAFLKLLSEEEFIDDVVMQKTISLIGDLAKIFNKSLVDHLTQPFIKTLMNKCRLSAKNNGDGKMQDAVRYAGTHINAVTGQKYF